MREELVAQGLVRVTRVDKCADVLDDELLVEDCCIGDFILGLVVSVRAEHFNIGQEHADAEFKLLVLEPDVHLLNLDLQVGQDGGSRTRCGFLVLVLLVAVEDGKLLLEHGEQVLLELLIPAQNRFLAPMLQLERLEAQENFADLALHALLGHVEQVLDFDLELAQLAVLQFERQVDPVVERVLEDQILHADLALEQTHAEFVARKVYEVVAQVLLQDDSN